MLTQRREDRAGDQRRGSDQVLAQALAAAGSCAYRWSIGSDEINWSENAPGVLGVAAPGAIATGRAFAGLLDPGNVTSRFETVMRSASRDMGEGVAFRVEYLLRPKGRQAAEAIWVEDHGRW